MKPVMEKHDEPRHPSGPRPISGLIPRVVRPAFRARSPATAQVLADWDAIVGPALAAMAQPRRLSGGTLTLACTGPAALEIQHAQAQLMERINAHLGQIVVQRLKVVQEALPPVRTKRLPALTPSPAAKQAAERGVASLKPGELRDALRALAEAVLTRQHRT